MALDKQTISVDFTKGLDQRTSGKLVLGGKLTMAQDVVYRGKTVERRSGFSKLGTSVLGGGSLSSLVAGWSLDGELLAQGSSLWSYQVQGNQWVSRGTGVNMTAIKKTTAFKSSDTVIACDIATINGYTVNLLHTEPTTTPAADNIVAVVIDESTGSVVSTASLSTVSVTRSIPRVAAFSNIFLAFWLEGGNITVSKFDTTAPNSGWTAKATLVANNSGAYDVTTVSNRCFMANQISPGSNGSVSEIGTGATIIAGPTDSTSLSDQGIALASTLDNFLILLTNNGANGLRRIVFNLSLTITQAVAVVDAGSSASTVVAMGYIPLASSADIYYAFTYGSGTRIKFVNLTSGGTISAPKSFFLGAAPASFPFSDSAGRRYLWAAAQWSVTSGAPNAGNNTIERCLFLVEDTKKDGTAPRIIGQALQGSSRWALDNKNYPSHVIADTNGSPATISPEQFILGLTASSTGVITNTSVVGASRLTAIPQAGAPITKAQLGGLQIIGGGVPMVYDGGSPVELGFLQFPETIALAQSAGGGLTNNSTYQYAATYEWVDLKGNRWQSSPTPPQSIALGANGTVTVTVPALRHTLKSSTSRTDVRIVIWRSQSNGSTLNRVTALTNSTINSTASDTFAIVDAAADTTIASNEILYTARSLSNVNPPAARLPVAHQNRLFLMGMEDPNLVWYSRRFVNGDGINFNDTLTFRVNPWGGDITGGASLDDKLVIFEQTATMIVYGSGPNDLGAQNSFSEPQLVSNDIGCADARSIVSTPFGIVFLSQKGFYLLDRGLQLQYLGAAVENLIKPLGFGPVPAVTSVQLLQNRNQVRWTLKPVGYFTPNGQQIDTPGVCLVLDYTDALATDGAEPPTDRFKWSAFTNYYAADAVIWNGQYTQIGTDNIVKVDSESTNQDQSTENKGIVGVIETGWLRLKGVQDFGRIWRVLMTGAANSASHNFTVYIGYDYNPNYEESLTSGQLLNGANWQFRHKIAFRQKCQAIRFRIVGTSELDGKWSLENLTLEAGIKKGAMKLPARTTV